MNDIVSRFLEDTPEANNGWIISDTTISRYLLFKKLNKTDKMHCEFSYWGQTCEHSLSMATLKVIGEENLYFSEFGTPVDKKALSEDDYDDRNYIYTIKNGENYDLIHKKSNSIYFVSNSAENAKKLKTSYTDKINKVLKGMLKKEVLNNKISLLMKSDSYYFNSVNIDIENVKDLDLELHYGTGFAAKSGVILENLKNKSKGIYLFHGKMGAGKTSYLKYLTSRIHDKKIIFIPPYFTDFLSSPEFLPTLIGDYGAKNSILIIEDAEKAVMAREDSDNNGNSVASLLSLGDGILSDVANIQIICTFNTRVENIDSALLRKGRLIAELNFNALSISDSQKLVDKLAKDGKIKKFKVVNEMTLAEIYGAEQDNFHEEKQTRKIGFSV